MSKIRMCDCDECENTSINNIMFDVSDAANKELNNGREMSDICEVCSKALIMDDGDFSISRSGLSLIHVNHIAKLDSWNVGSINKLSIHKEEIEIYKGALDRAGVSYSSLYAKCSHLHKSSNDNFNKLSSAYVELESSHKKLINKYKRSIIMITTQTKKVRMLTLKAALKLEIHGMKRHGRSAYSIIKEEYGFKGNKKSVLLQLEGRIKENMEEK